MKDFPMFTTEYGMASLILKEVPYRQVAFVNILDVQVGSFAEHLAECVSFCRMAGAERIYAKGHENLEQYPLHSIVWKMSMPLDRREPEACLWPVTEETVGSWREIYNKGMRPFDNHATMTAHDEKKIIQSGGAYFVHRDGTLLGIGWIRQSELLELASTVPGAGESVMHTLMSIMPGQVLKLQVVSTNFRAISLYERLGFVKTAEKSRWYQVHPDKKSENQKIFLDVQ